MKLTQSSPFGKLLRHTARPGASALGRFMLWGMNIGHSPVYEFGLSHVELPRGGRILDVGCGGGELLRRMAKRAPDATLAGVDVSTASVEASRRRNRRAIEAADPEDARIWTDVVPGMRVRTAEELSELLVAAGFSQPAVHRKSASANAWTCLVAERGKA